MIGVTTGCEAFESKWHDWFKQLASSFNFSGFSLSAYADLRLLDFQLTHWHDQVETMLLSDTSHARIEFFSVQVDCTYSPEKARSSNTALRRSFTEERVSNKASITRNADETKKPITPKAFPALQGESSPSRSYWQRPSVVQPSVEIHEKITTENTWNDNP